MYVFTIHFMLFGVYPLKTFQILFANSFLKLSNKGLKYDPSSGRS